MAGYGVRALLDSRKGVSLTQSFLNRGTLTTILIATVMALSLGPLISSSYKLISSQTSRSESRDYVTHWIESERDINNDVAIVGSLQLPISIFTLRGVDAYSPTKQSLAELAQSGYEIFIVPSDINFLDAEIAELNQSIAGEPWPQRVPINPAISILKIKPHGLEKAARRAPRTLAFNSSKGSAYPVCPEMARESHCWISSRITELKLPEVNGPTNLEVMSPWSNQLVTVSDSTGGLLASLKLRKTNTWETLPIPTPPNTGLRSVIVTITAVHSPESQGVNPDRRRLGLAIRGATSLSLPDEP